ncbi:similar to cDNA sequence BC056474 (predicted), isoform CRA_b [Rattus norvegicus]|uniref:PAT complex subunit Asterix n=2 Tax=Rattus norvegicus TaxID=10116 RepID=A6IY25_RAT|nr:PAT complex subunit Asterix isoform 2 [Rattus norvegicus]EDL92154.1 similar to cDNA sequence BC056474 (predicted), isoform CRA_b [Rattus norvegicus]|eukprot:NP_001099417.1 protein Asterix [Rattus norvegicus]
MSTNNMSDPRRPNKVLRYKPPPSECNPALDDPTPDYMNLLGMIFSMCGLMLKALNLRRGDVLSAESSAHDAPMVMPPRKLCSQTPAHRRLSGLAFGCLHPPSAAVLNLSECGLWAPS